jgi:hypothetical protein
MSVECDPLIDEADQDEADQAEALTAFAAWWYDTIAPVLYGAKQGRQVQGLPKCAPCSSCNTLFLFPDPRQSQCQKCRKNRNRHGARDTRRAAHDIDFVAIDGEGITFLDPASGRVEHQYVLMCASGCEPLHKNGARLTTQQIFDWLYNTVYKSNPSAAFVGYFLGYDWSQWFRDLPIDRGEKLYLKDEIAKRQRTARANLPPYPVYWEEAGWEFDLLGDVRFKLRPCLRQPKQTGKVENKFPWLYICDAGPFYQTSFLNAINPKSRLLAGVTPIVSDEQYQKIKAGKEKRGDEIFGPEMIEYCQLEVDICAKLLKEMNESLVAKIAPKSILWPRPSRVQISR